MFGLFSKISGLTTPWLDDAQNFELLTLHLTNIPPTSRWDADALWDNSFGGGQSICEKSTNSTDHRLRAALDAHRVIRHKKDKDSGFSLGSDLVFTDVIIWIPKDIWHIYARQGGDRLIIMSERLKTLHLRHFSEELHDPERDPRYAIMPHAELADGDAIIQFGLGVFIPDHNDKRVANISVMKQGYTPAQLPELTLFTEKGQEKFPAALYEKQRFLRLAKNFQFAALHPDTWFDEDDGYVMIAFDANHKPSSMYSDEKYITTRGHLKPYKDRFGHHCVFYSTANPHDRIKITISDATTHQPPPPKKQKPTFSSGNSGTIIPVDGDDIIGVNVNEDSPDFGENTLTNSIFYVTLTAIILPKLSRDPKLAYWQLLLDENAMPTSSPEKACCQLKGKSAIEWRLREGENEELQWQKLDNSSVISCLHNKKLHLQKPYLNDEQLAILPLSQPQSYRLSDSSLIIGRGDAKQADILLDQLIQENSLVSKMSINRLQTLGHIGISGKHLKVKLDTKGLQITHLSSSVGTHILRDGMIGQTLYANQSESVTIALNQSFIIGCYVLEFQKAGTNWG